MNLVKLAALAAIVALGAPLTTAVAKTGQAKFAPAQSSVAGLTFGDWNFSSDSLDANWTSGDFNAPTHVHLDRPGNTVDADRAVGNFKQKFATFYGHVVLHDASGAFSSLAGGRKGGQPSTLLCDQLQVDSASKLYTATGSVHFTQGASALSADRAVLNQATHELHLSGHVHVIQ